jgi:tetratricopeptide (TPR) repeat protein
VAAPGQSGQSPEKGILQISMRSRLIVAALAFALVSCGTNVKDKYLTEGNRLFSRGEYVKAAGAYREAASIDPQLAFAHYGEGRCLLRMGRYPEAQQALRRANELFPEGSSERNDAKLQLAYALVHGWNDEDLAEVEIVAVALCKRDPNSFDGRRLLGDLALVRARKWASGKTPKVERSEFYLNDALFEYGVAAKVRPDDPSLPLQIARALALKGSLEESERSYRTAIRKDTKQLEPYAELYRVLLAEDKLPEAAEVLKQAAADLPSDPGFAIMLAAQALVSDPNTAPPFIERLKSRDLNLPAANLIVGDFYLRAGRLDRAEREYRNCFSSKKYELACRVRLIRMALFENNQNGLQLLVMDTLRLDHQNTAALTAQAVIKASSGDTDGAERQLRGLLDVDTDGPFARYYLASLQARQGQSQEARQTLDVALREQPDLLGARLLLARSQLVLRDYADAQKSAELVLAVRNDDTRARQISHAAQAALLSSRELAKLFAVPTPENLAEGNPGLAGNSPGFPETLPETIKLKDSVSDVAIEAFKKLRAKDYAKVDLVAAVPGLWSAGELGTYIGN